VTTHFGYLVLFAACVSVVFAALLRDDARAQVRTGLRMFGGFVVGAYVLGWIMFVVFG
jgi:hypothetical protein